MLSGILVKLRDALTIRQQLDFDYEEVFSCARCGLKIESLTDSPHLNTGEDLLFFCSERCYLRFMQHRLNKQARWAGQTLKKIQRNNPTIISISAGTPSPNINRQKDSDEAP